MTKWTSPLDLVFFSVAGLAIWSIGVWWFAKFFESWTDWGMVSGLCASGLILMTSALFLAYIGNPLEQLRNSIDLIESMKKSKQESPK